MPRKPNEPSIVCQYFTWRLFRRDRVFYADGRGGKHDLGKHSLGTRNREEALDLLRMLDRKMAAELGLATDNMNQAAELLIEQGWKQYLDHVGRHRVEGGASPATVKRYGAVRDKHVKFCSRRGIRSWNEFSKDKLKEYSKWLGRRAADRTLFLELTLLKSVNHWLVAEETIPAECRIEYKLSKPQGSDTYCYKRSEVGAMVKHCMATSRLVWLGHVIIALAHTGLRISELANLRWSDVDLSSNTIRVADERASRRKRQLGTVRTTKGRRTRTIPIHPRLRATLLSLSRKPNGCVFHTERGGRLRPNNVLHVFIRDVIVPLKETFPTPPGEIGYEHGRLHSFRHFFCSESFRGGALEGEIKEWLGHTDSKMTEYCRHLRSKDAQRKMEQIDFLAEEGDEGCPTDAA